MSSTREDLVKRLNEAPTVSGQKAPPLRAGDNWPAPFRFRTCEREELFVGPLERSLFLTLHPTVGPGRPVRRQREPLGCASPEHPPPSGVGSVNELHLLWRKERSKSMDVFLRQKIEEYGSEEMLGKLLNDVEYEIHQRKKA